MLVGLTVLLVFQLLGEIAGPGLGLGFPGPVAGMVMLAVIMALAPRLHRMVQPTANGLFRTLGLLFVPASVGVIDQAGILRDEGVAIVVAVIVSSGACFVVTALTFRWVAAWSGVTLADNGISDP